MAPLPVVTPRQLIRPLEKAGFFVHHLRGSHHFLKHSHDALVRVTVAYHSRPLKRGIPHAVLRRYSGLAEELTELLRPGTATRQPRHSPKMAPIRAGASRDDPPCRFAVAALPRGNLSELQHVTGNPRQKAGRRREA